MRKGKSFFTTTGMVVLSSLVGTVWFCVVRFVAQPMLNGGDREVAMGHTIINGFWLYILLLVILAARHFYKQSRIKKFLKGEIDPWE